jgi:transcriptional repressor NrdR
MSADTLTLSTTCCGRLLPGVGAVRCPWCGYLQDKVIDSRSAEGGASVRRRRQCLKCSRRFTTFERVEPIGLNVVKRDGAKQPFERAKVIAGVRKAIKNRPVTEEQVAKLADRVEGKLRRKGPMVTTQEVGIEVLDLLRRLDDVAYLRFASVYKDFQELTDFERELGILLQKREAPRLLAGPPKGPRRRRG